MGVPISEVSCTSATIWSGEHAVNKGHVVVLEKLPRNTYVFIREAAAI
jgi:mevalonate kinase